MSNIKHQGFLLRKSLLSLGVAALGLVALTSACSAGQTQSSEDSQPTVASILAAPTDGMSVTLQGYILQPGDDDEEYIFTDGVDEIVVEIYDEDFRIAPDVLIEITGEVDLEAEDSTQHEAHPEAVEIDVDQFQIVTSETPAN